MSSCEDKDLMLAASQGDREALGISVERYHHAIMEFAHGFVGVRGDNPAEGIAQDVFPAAWKAVIDGDKIKLWQVFADNTPVEKIMREDAED